MHEAASFVSTFLQREAASFLRLRRIFLTFFFPFKPRSVLRMIDDTGRYGYNSFDK